MAWLVVAFWLYYAFLRQVAGPLNGDEIYFSHTLWLLNQGKRQYVDFYSNHLPTYFQLLRPLTAAISSSTTDLSYLWGLRALSGLLIAAYVALAWKLWRDAMPPVSRLGFFGMVAMLLIFVVLGRMVEIRTDTFGLILMNAAWALALSGCSPRRVAGAAVLAGLAGLFSARAAGIVGVFGVLLLYLAVRARDPSRVRALLYVAGSFLTAGLILWLIAPEWVALVLRSCFLEPAKLLGGAVPLRERLLAVERIPLTLMIVGGLLAGLRLMSGAASERGLIIAVACSAQLLMILLDPAPFQYVYGWAAVPAVLGLVSVSRLLSVFFPAFWAATLVSLAIGYGVVKHASPPTSSYFRLTLDASLSESELAHVPTPELVMLLMSDKLQMNLTNQLRVRSEVCQRLGGSTLASFDTHPVCLGDAMFYWTGLRWPAFLVGDVATVDAMSLEAFGRTLVSARPSLIIWAHRWGNPRALLPETRQMLACCYDIYDGFALSTSAPPATVPVR